MQRAVVIVVGLAAGLWAAIGLGARAEHDARLTADEPQYLLSAISLAEDGDLNIRDELNQLRALPFHAAVLPQQTRPLDSGRTRLSPHDPGLPVLLTPAVWVGLQVGDGTGAWVAAKLTMAALAGALAAATVWVATRRFGAPPLVAGAVVGAFAVVPPLAVYGTQLYPELPAGLAVVGVVGAVTAPRPGRIGPLVVTVAGLVVLPWLSVKYVPVVVALGVVAAWRLWRTGARRPLGVLAGAGVVGAVTFVLGHLAIYGGVTAYAAGDHFVDGQLTVVGTPDLAGRATRLVGLLVDDGFGLVAWAPAFLLAVPALAALVRRRPDGWVALAAPLGAGWLTASFVALTMHGWWWPGRQVVLVVPLLVVTMAWAGGRLVRERSRWASVAATALAVATAWGTAVWLWLLVEVLRGDRQLIIDFEQTAAPTSAAWRALLLDGRADPVPVLALTAWTALLGLAAVAGWRIAAPQVVPDRSPEPVSDPTLVPDPEANRIDDTRRSPIPL